MARTDSGSVLARAGESGSRSSQAFERLRGDILAGRLLLGQKLPFADLTKE
ncbi:hypothetical protein ABZ848_49045 [Streptomyces sp. NPDC047081]|uniref:hypothetical protein n=1 Tax=Streptomyces sp. NPDC047081 TaxID=3154706 RepID=UPI0033E206AF